MASERERLPTARTHLGLHGQVENLYSPPLRMRIRKKPVGRKKFRTGHGRACTFGVSAQDHLSRYPHLCVWEVTTMDRIHPCLGLVRAVSSAGSLRAVLTTLLMRTARSSLLAVCALVIGSAATADSIPVQVLDPNLQVTTF